jgi:transcriptional regulator with XRE-family HTH domain
MDAQKTGAYLAALRKARGLTQQEIAERLGVSNKTVSKWESGGGFPDITVLPALAELYGVAADDILAGETLTEKRRESAGERVAEQRKRLLSRLRTRFDVCFAISLALAAIARLGVPYVSLAALPLSAALVWIGYILVARPVRDGIAAADGALWLDLLRKLFAALTGQWYVLVCMIRFGDLDMARSDFGETPVLRYQYDNWKPLVFLIGLLMLGALFQWWAGRLVGRKARLLPGSWAVWLCWGLWAVLLVMVWNVVDSGFDTAMDPWIRRYGRDVLQNPNFDTVWPKLKARRDAEILPWLWARRGTLAAGALSGLALLRQTILRKKKHSPLAEKPGT